jgi:hypothetical protein
LASTPSACCWSRGVGAIEVFSRSISDGVTLAGRFDPGTPVRKATARSWRGNLVGAGALGNSVWISAGSVGVVT